MQRTASSSPAGERFNKESVKQNRSSVPAMAAVSSNRGPLANAVKSFIENTPLEEELSPGPQGLSGGHTRSPDYQAELELAEERLQELELQIALRKVKHARAASEAASQIGSTGKPPAPKMPKTLNTDALKQHDLLVGKGPLYERLPKGPHDGSGGNPSGPSEVIQQVSDFPNPVFKGGSKCPGPSSSGAVPTANTPVLPSEAAPPTGIGSEA